MRLHANMQLRINNTFFQLRFCRLGKTHTGPTYHPPSRSDNYYPSTDNSRWAKQINVRRNKTVDGALIRHYALSDLFVRFGVIKRSCKHVTYWLFHVLSKHLPHGTQFENLNLGKTSLRWKNVWVLSFLRSTKDNLLCVITYCWL